MNHKPALGHVSMHLLLGLALLRFIACSLVKINHSDY